MKAICHYTYGSPDVLELADIDMPVPGDEDVLVRVHAVSLNRADWFVTTGTPYAIRLAFGLRRPKNPVLGRDVAGRVTAVGAKVTRFQPGDEVYAEISTGSLAEYARVPERLLARKPANLTFEQAAAVPLAAVTALAALSGRVRSGDEVLINGASGGVGTFAVQIAKAFGARVTGVCSTRNTDLVRSLGADDVIDYTKDDFTRGERRYDVILDLVGNHRLSALRRTLTPAGTLLLSAGDGGRWFGPMRRILLALVISPFGRQSLRTVNPGRSDLAELTGLIEAGKVTPAIDRTYPLSETAEALRYLGVEHARAKVVITVHP
ncbi:NAD(P)-dependent alcohol dehydrogenase [Nonomuraea sp. ZG12]|jgi:NADPH:quinone reductase-like Zn-dependent oxidoreductase|uniref:NAD(P)-dependent alcohol dehydrogenase n=1 Tax=Nonomuraea sp. ZG12 TaxID=3452207 RepID=UPI003F8BBE91